MKSFYLSTAILLLSLAFAGSSYAFDIPDDYTNEITAVNFYPSGAKFTFTIQDYDDDGNFTAYLPGAFSPESIRAVNPDSVIGDIKAIRTSRTKWIPSQLEELKAQADEQSQKLNELTARQAALEQTLHLLRESVPDKTRTASLLTYIKDAQTLRLETENELAKLKNEIITEREKLSIMNNELKAKSPASDTSFITVSGRAKDRVTIEAFTGYASWRPEYIMNLDSSTGDINVQMFVRASQRTGLNYEGNVTFHTKSTNERLTAPVLNPIKVGIKPKQETIAAGSMVRLSRTNRMYKSARAEEDAMMMADMAAAEYDDEELEAPAAPRGPAISESISDRTVRVHGLITGDGTENQYAVIMNEMTLTSTPAIVLIPEQRSNAWIMASMDEGNQHLIPGEAELRVDGHTSGKMHIDEFGIGQKSIPFGYAEQITVKKEALIEKTGTSWFSGVFTSGYKLEITNGTKEDKTVKIHDRLPVPTDDKIKLNINSIEPKQKEKDNENRLTWELNIPAGETSTIIVDYTLSYPSGEELLYK